MGRRIVKLQGVVLRTRRLGETSKLVTLYTRERGKLAATAKGARRPRSKFGAALELFNEVRVVCYVREERTLQTLSEAEIAVGYAARLTDVQRLGYAGAACELVERLTLEEEPNRRLYRCLTGVLAGLAEVDAARLEPLFWYYELRAVEALGYRPELARCAGCGRELSGSRWWFSPARGGAACAACAGGDGIPVGGDSLRFLARLQALPAYHRERIPPLPPRPGEIRDALRVFLEFYAGGRGTLRALEFVEAHRRRGDRR